MYVIFGASGNVGRATVEALRRAGVPVRAVLRDERCARPFERLGCEVAYADMSRSVEIARAMAGARAVQILCPVPRDDPQPEETMRRTIDAVSAALRAAPPPVLLALSDYGAEVPSGTGITTLFHEMEEQWRDLASRSSMLRSAEHMHNWARVIPAALATGTLPSFHHPVSKHFPTVAASDVGGVAAALLLDSESGSQRRIVSVEGERRIDVCEVAQALSRASGRDIEAIELPRGEWERTLLSAGMSPAYVRLIVELYDAHNAGRIDVEPGLSERRFGETTIDTVFAGLVPSGAAARIVPPGHDEGARR